MKQAAIFICTFAVLFQLYAGASATDSSDDSSDTVYNLKTILEIFKEKVEALGNSSNITMQNSLNNLTDLVIYQVTNFTANVEAANLTTPEVIEALKNVRDNMINTSLTDTYYTVAAFSTLINLVQTNAITSAKLIEALIDAIVVIFTPVDSTTTKTPLEILIEKIAAAIKVVEAALADAISENLPALKAFLVAFYEATASEIQTTYNVSKADIKLIQAYIGSLFQ